MNLAEIKSHAQKIIQTVNELDAIGIQLHELTKEVLGGMEVNVSIMNGDLLSFNKSEIQSLMESRVESLEGKLKTLRSEIN